MGKKARILGSVIFPPAIPALLGGREVGAVANPVGAAAAEVGTRGVEAIQPTVPEIPGPPPSPVETAPPVAAARESPIEAAERIRRETQSKTRRSTVLTSPLGLGEPSNTAKRFLLGR